LARAKRHYIPGHVWHITHRCHKREFLLKFAKDRHRWLQWLYEARKRYSLVILNYAVTSNHIHLLVQDANGRNGIPKSIQLVAGRTGQEFNNRKKRKGAFWEDRYHATAIETGLSCVCGFKYGSGRRCESPGALESWRVQRNSASPKEKHPHRLRSIESSFWFR